MKKLTYEYVKEQIEKEGYELLSKEYKNSNTKLKVKCPKDHEYEVRYNNWYNKSRCSICYGNSKKTLVEVKDSFYRKGLILLDDVYINRQQLLSVKCIKCGNIFKSSIWKINRNMDCKKCSNIKYTESFVKEELLKYNYILVSPYRKTRDSIKIKCNKGHIYNSTFSQFMRKSRCYICSGNHKLKYSYVKEQIENVEGYELLSKEYKNNVTKLKLLCPKDHVCKISYSNFSKGRRCKKCYDGKNHSNQEKEILKIVENLLPDKKIIPNDRTQIINPKTGKNLELDIWIPELNKAIEFNGEYWHLNRKDIDEIKINECIKNNINLLVIWDYEWIKNKEKCIKNIREFVNV